MVTLSITKMIYIKLNREAIKAVPHTYGEDSRQISIYPGESENLLFC